MKAVIALIVVLALAGLGWALFSKDVELRNSVLARKVLGDSLAEIRTQIARLKVESDSLRVEAERRDTVWLRARDVAAARREEVLANPESTPTELREVIDLDVEAINACDASLETCQERRVNAERQLDLAKEEHRIEVDSLAIEIDDRDDAIDRGKKEVKKQKLITVGVVLLSILSLFAK